MDPQYLTFDRENYWILLALLLFARGMDFLSTWIATPNLILEGNPLAKMLGWRRGILLNLGICFLFAGWRLPAVVIITSSALVAARNLQSAWLMRALGEHEYSSWLVDRIEESNLGLFLFCLIAQGALIGGVGIMLVVFSTRSPVAFAVGIGIVTYAVAVVGYSLLSLRRVRRHRGSAK